MSSRDDAVIVAVARTPIGRFGGGLMSSSAVALGASAIRAAVERAGIDPGDVDEVVVGHARQAGNGPNPGRLMALAAGLSVSAPVCTVQQACVSSMKALLLAAQSIRLGDARTVVVAGSEHMSSIPYLALDQRWGKRMGDVTLVDGMHRDGFIDPRSKQHMGALAEAWADRFSIGRYEQDVFALRSQQRAESARTSGFAGRMIAPISTGEKGASTVEADEHPRPDTTIEGLGKLKPAFRPDGTVTPGNASGITDGAAAAVVMAASEAAKRGLRAIAVITATDVSGVEPADYGLAPVASMRRALKKAGLPLDRIGHVEINEAFAVQVLACCRELDLAAERVNPFGGAIALGHPVGMSGLRIVIYAACSLAERNARSAIASLCGNGGHAGTVVLERA